MTPAPTYNADVYVFAIHTARTHEEYNPLLASQWRFHVLPKRTVEDLDQDSIGLTTLEGLAGPPIAYEKLSDSINAAAKKEHKGPQNRHSETMSTERHSYPP